MRPILIGADGNAAAVMDELDRERRARGWSMAEMEERIGVSTSAWFQWRLGRAPRLLYLLDLMEALGFRLVLINERERVPVTGSTAIIFSRIDQQRRQLGLEVADLEVNAGVSQSTYFACRSGRRNPSLRTFVKMVGALGWRVHAQRLEAL